MIIEVTNTIASGISLNMISLGECFPQSPSHNLVVLMLALFRPCLLQLWLITGNVHV